MAPRPDGVDHSPKALCRPTLLLGDGPINFIASNAAVQGWVADNPCPRFGGRRAGAGLLRFEV